MKKMLLNCLIVTFMILVTFFLVVPKTQAAKFKYSDFNWEELLEQNKDYWISGCDDGDEKCYDRIIKHQKDFYVRLYKILAHYQDVEGVTIDDKIIIETSFFGITPDSFRDPIDGEDNPYNIGVDDYNSYIGSNANADGAQEYFQNEKDSLKTLINNMVSYKMPCYGVSGERPTTVNGVNTCNDGFTADGNDCIVLVDNLSISFSEGLFKGIPILGLFKTNSDTACSELTSDYSGYKLGDMSKKQEVDEEEYWEFLVNSDYFDKKKHLQSHYGTVLKKTNHSNMSELSPEEYKEYEKLIKEIRRNIVENIKSVIEEYEPFSSDVSMTSAKQNAYWWPIGSVETTDSNGKIMAAGDPESITITSKYGLRTDPITNEENSQHNGIDISGVTGSTNVIAAKSGTVVYAPDADGGTCVEGDASCGGGYGNYVIIQHVDGNYTLYAHLDTNSVVVKNGDNVSQGQVIGKVGSTGKSSGGHLHFEVRVGGNDSNSTQDPLNFVDPNEPRKSGDIGELEEWLVELETAGRKEDYMRDGKYIVFDAEKIGLYRSIANGIVIDFNKDLMRKYGLDPDAYNYGDLIEAEPMDRVMVDLVSSNKDYILSLASQNGFSLNEQQVHALSALKYNSGNLDGFVNAYKTYGATQSLCDNYWIGKDSSTYPGLPARRKAECKLFVEGVYTSPYS